MVGKSDVRFDVAADAAALLAEFDAGQLEGYVEERTPEALADFWLESQFARGERICDWPPAMCRTMMRRMAAELRALGV